MNGATVTVLIVLLIAAAAIGYYLYIKKDKDDSDKPGKFTCSSRNAFEISPNNCVDGSDIIKATPECLKTLFSGAKISPTYPTSCAMSFDPTNEKYQQFGKYMMSPEGVAEVTKLGESCPTEIENYVKNVLSPYCPNAAGV